MILTITGPSGSGKSSLVRLMKQKYGAKSIISAPTRKPRKKEKDGVDYRFVKEFQPDDFFEYTQFGGHFYGRLKSDIHAAENDEFENIYFVIVDRHGANFYKKHARNVFSVYLETPMDFAEGNLVHRDGKKAAKERIKEDAQQGLYCSSGYDCILKSDYFTSIDALSYQLLNYIIALKERKNLKGAA